MPLKGKMPMYNMLNGSLIHFTDFNHLMIGKAASTDGVTKLLGKRGMRNIVYFNPRVNHDRVFRFPLWDREYDFKILNQKTHICPKLIFS